MSIPLIGFLYLYLLFVAVWFIFSLIAFYHIIKFGEINLTSFMVILVYLAVSTAILYLSFLILSQIDWSISLTIFQGGSRFFGPSNF